MSNEIGPIGKALVIPLKYIILIVLVIKRALVDYVTRPGDMTKAQFVSFHSVLLVYTLLICIMVFVKPIGLMGLFVFLIVFQSFSKG